MGTPRRLAVAAVLLLVLLEAQSSLAEVFMTGQRERAGAQQSPCHVFGPQRKSCVQRAPKAAPGPQPGPRFVPHNLFGSTRGGRSAEPAMDIHIFQMPHTGKGKPDMRDVLKFQEEVKTYSRELWKRKRERAGLSPFPDEAAAREAERASMDNLKGGTLQIKCPSNTKVRAVDNSIPHLVASAVKRGENPKRLLDMLEENNMFNESSSCEAVFRHGYYFDPSRPDF